MLAFDISVALLAEGKWIPTNALIFAGQKREAILLPLSHFFLTRLARVYDLFLTAPIPPRSQDASNRAAAIRDVIHFVQTHPDPVIAPAPEGMDIPGGGLGWSLSGVRRFILKLILFGLAIIPVGCANGLQPPAGLAPIELDQRIRAVNSRMS